MSKAAVPDVCACESPSDIIAADFCVPASEEEERSPIDDYYRYTESIVQLGTSGAVASNPLLGRLLLLGLVAGVELYLRSIIARTVQVCPIARSEAALSPVPFASVDFYGARDLGLAFFDGQSLASAAEVQKKTRTLLGLEWKNNNSVAVALAEFDKLCQLRHASVHSRGTLQRPNLQALGLDLSMGASVKVGYDELQAAGATCHSVVRAYNRFVWFQTVARWRSKNRFQNGWTIDKLAFKPLWFAFHSTLDDSGPGVNAYNAYRAIRAATNS